MPHASGIWYLGMKDAHSPRMHTFPNMPIVFTLKHNESEIYKVVFWFFFTSFILKYHLSNNDLLSEKGARVYLLTENLDC